MNLTRRSCSESIFCNILWYFSSRPIPFEDLHHGLCLPSSVDEETWKGSDCETSPVRKSESKKGRREGTIKRAETNLEGITDSERWSAQWPLVTARIELTCQGPHFLVLCFWSVLSSSACLWSVAAVYSFDRVANPKLLSYQWFCSSWSWLGDTEKRKPQKVRSLSVTIPQHPCQINKDQCDQGLTVPAAAAAGSASNSEGNEPSSARPCRVCSQIQLCYAEIWNEDLWRFVRICENLSWPEDVACRRNKRLDARWMVSLLFRCKSCPRKGDHVSTWMSKYLQCPPKETGSTLTSRILWQVLHRYHQISMVSIAF